MNKTKIEWVQGPNGEPGYTWNPVTGCLHNCPYCYARRIAERFGLDFAPKLDDPGMEGACKYDSAEGMDTMLELEKPYVKGGRIQPYPMAFLPTFHRYRLDEPARKTKGQKIFVCSMADLFGDWVPDEWIQEVFKACEAAPQHKYLFLTKNPSRYWQLHDKGILPQHNNYWYGTTLTHSEDEHEVANNLPAYTGLPKPTFRNTFVSAEPILDNIEGVHPMGGFFTYYPHTIKWAILGAETGSRKGKVIPRRKWIESIVSACHKADVPVFMKNSLKDLMGDDFIQQWPEGLKQLEDAAECLARFHERTCGQCSCNKFRYGYVGSYGCTENAAQTALAYREMLERIEWCCLTDYGIGRAPTCPFCGNVKSEGHKPDCEWVVAMKGKRG